MYYFKNISLFLLFSVFVFCNKEQNQRIFPKQYAIPGIEKSLIDKSNEIGFENFKYLLQSKNEDLNLLISPVCMSNSFNSLLQASNSTTRDRIKHYLQIKTIQDSALNKSYDYLHQVFAEIDKNTLLENAEIFAFSHDFIPEGGFKSFIDARKYISISNGSHSGFIADNNIQEKELSTSFQYINSIHFKARSKFQKKLEESPFYFNPDKSDFVQMIVSEATYNYYGDASLKAVEIPLGRGNFNMLILIPQGSQTLDDLARKVDMRLLNKIRTRYKPQNLEIFMPKLHLSTMESYTGILKEKLSCCFLPKDADFSGLSKIDRFYLNNFEQVINFELGFSTNSDLDINSETINTDKGEKGSVFIDHPFLFVIYEKYADAVLFIGRIVKP